LYNDPRRNEREHAFIIEMAVPEGGFGRRLDAMHDWHRARFLEHRAGRGRHADGINYVRWCFKDPRDAEDFMMAFGGALVPPGRSHQQSR
jgi:hypothetical protein